MMIHLHTHTEGSFFDGCCKLNELFLKCQKENMPAIGITDHHNVYSWFKAAKLAKQYNIKAIYGMELNVDKHHLVGLAMNETGLKHLLLLNNLAYSGKRSGKVKESEVFTYSEGIFFLSGCTKGKIPSLLLQGQYEKAEQAAKLYQEKCNGNFALEIQSYQFSSKQQMVKDLISLAKKCQLLIVPTNDCHFLEKNDYGIHHQLVHMHTQGKIKLRNTQNYVKNYDEMRKVFPASILKNTEVIAEQCNVDFLSFMEKQNGTYELPLSMMYYYDEAEALKKALFSNKKYALGNFLYKKMKKENLSLCDIRSGEIEQELLFAQALKEKLYKVERDPYYYIKVNEYFPIYRKSKEEEPAAQVDYWTAKELGFFIEDRRKPALEIN